MTRRDEPNLARSHPEPELQYEANNEQDERERRHGIEHSGPDASPQRQVDGFESATLGNQTLGLGMTGEREAQAGTRIHPIAWLRCISRQAQDRKSEKEDHEQRAQREPRPASAILIVGVVGHDVCNPKERVNVSI
jgi:hypothetical protein